MNLVGLVSVIAVVAGATDGRLKPSKCRFPLLGSNRDVLEFGICVPLNECPPVVAIVTGKKPGKRPEICAVDATAAKVYVCCRVSAVKCREYRQEVTSIVESFESNSGIGSLRVWGNSTTKRPPRTTCPGEAADTRPLVYKGVPANPDEFPHMVAVGKYVPREGMFFPCGGSLISKTWVLTAAHCFLDILNFVRIYNGKQELYSSFDPSRDFRFSTYIVHPKYEEGSKYHDLALIRMDNGPEVPVRLSVRIYPGCLSQFPPTTVDQKLDVVGWGGTVHYGAKSAALLKGTIPLLPQEKCSQLLRSHPLLNANYPHGANNGVICALDKQEGRDACLGDSGGPLCVRDRESCVFDIIGVVSTGLPCGSKVFPGLFADVNFHLSWIERHVWPLDEVIKDMRERF